MAARIGNWHGLSLLHCSASLGHQESCVRPQVLAKVAARTAEACGADSGYLRIRLTEQNAAAVALHKAGDYVGALAAYALMFRRQHAQNLAHADLHVCYACGAQLSVYHM